MPVITDQLGRTVEIATAPRRIISTVPSQTELLFYLGLGHEITGITKFCTHPADAVRQKTKIGGTKQLNIPLIKSLKPDLIIANKEENERAQLEELMALYPTYVSDPHDLPSALQMIADVGRIAWREEAATQLADDITARFNSLQEKPTGLRVAYLIWRKPYMAAGTGTFINAMLASCGWQNAFAEDRYPEITLQKLIATAPDVVLLASEPYPFQYRHVTEINAILPGTPVHLVDGEMFSWYGSRLLQVPAYFKTVISSVQESVRKK